MDRLKKLKSSARQKETGAEGENRTPMGLPPLDFESSASTNFTTPALNEKGMNSLSGIRRRPTLPPRRLGSTMGAKGLNCCVRDGNRWVPFAISTGKDWRKREEGRGRPSLQDREEGSWGGSQATRSISTGQLSALPRVHFPPIELVIFQRPSGGKPREIGLGRGFPLRCFQRLSLPNIATRRCRWRDNRNTRGSSTPVLSY